MALLIMRFNVLVLPFHDVSIRNPSKYDLFTSFLFPASSSLPSQIDQQKFDGTLKFIINSLKVELLVDLFFSQVAARYSRTGVR